MRTVEKPAAAAMSSARSSRVKWMFTANREARSLAPPGAGRSVPPVASRAGSSELTTVTSSKATVPVSAESMGSPAISVIALSG